MLLLLLTLLTVPVENNVENFMSKYLHKIYNQFTFMNYPIKSGYEDKRSDKPTSILIALTKS